ncbi:MAG: sigma-70 family RNA polymerase sigma factor [Planctomycetota bacterium]
MADRPRPSAASRTQTDEDCLNAAHRDEFVCQLVRHERLLHAYIFSLVSDWAVAEEILQETYLRLFERLDEWDSTKELYPWACGFAHFQVLNYRNRTRRERLQFSQIFVDKVAATQQARSDHLKLRVEALEHCLEQLRPGDQRLLELAYRGDLGMDDVARLIERTVSATYQALSRVRKMLKQCVERSIRTLE